MRGTMQSRAGPAAPALPGQEAARTVSGRVSSPANYAAFGVTAVVTIADDLASGALVEVLSEFPPTPTPLSVLYPSHRQLSARVRVFVDWLVETIGPQLVVTG